MKTLLRLEQIAGFLFSIYLFSLLAYPWWAYPLLFLVPDLALFARAAGRRAGDFTYNLVHHQAVALGLYTLGMLLGLPLLSLVGAVFFGHAAFDRALGLGLMDGDTFSHAHLKPERPLVRRGLQS